MAVNVNGMWVQAYVTVDQVSVIALMMEAAITCEH
jgi:hypothetical protein